MIILEIEGGFGNQLFQLAMGVYLQRIWDEDVVLDLTRFKYDKREIRDFNLDTVSIPKEWKRIDCNKSKREIYGWRYNVWMLFTVVYQKTYGLFEKIGLRRWYGRFYQQCINAFGIYCVMDYYEDYYKPKNSLWKKKIVLGNWLWPWLIEHQGDGLKHMLKIKTPISKTNADYLSQIENCNSVAVHIRRGDYVTLGLVVCSIKYYEKCMDMMSELVDNPTFFIFSDGIDWCKENLSKKYKLVFVENNNSAPEDMRLIYSCKHIIMSSSTFSWWGAYLNSNPNKIIIAPKHRNVNHNRVTPLVRDYMIVVENKGE